MILTRDDVLEGLHDLARRLASEGCAVSIHVVGGAAIAISYNHDRHSTIDVDAWINSSSADHAARVVDIVSEIAVQRQWPSDWLNDKARLFIPDGVLAQREYWDVVIDAGKVRVLVARPEVMFAMKLHAARGRRDLPDLDDLLPHLGIISAPAAIELFERHYPHEVLKPTAKRWIAQRFADGA